MTIAKETGADFLAAWNANAATLCDTYDASQEHDSCGVGFVAALNGEKRRDIVQAGIDALKAVWHRGAVDADGKTGDGAGIHVEIPQDFFAAAVQRGGAKLMPGPIAVGQVFLPKTDLSAQERCRQIVETEVLNFGYLIYGWRQVPINVDCIGEKANATRPEIEQIMLWNPKGADPDEFERDLYVIRRRIEKQAIAAQIPELYFCSLSSRSIIYKGMFLAEHLAEFYPDLLDPRFVSRFAIYHQRYSTNTFPTWRLAQPFRMLAHNGEINTLTGNINWMKSHETRLSADELGPYLDDVKPVVQAGGSDTATLDNVFELMCRAGRDAPMAKALMIPASIGQDATMKQAHRDMFLYCNAVMEPWDGPAAIAATDGRWVIAGLDRNGLRPLRYTMTSDAMLIVGSETGMVKLDADRIIEKGRVGPGQTIAVNLEHARFYHDEELKDVLAARQPFGDWARRITEIDHIVKTDAPEPVLYQGEELRRRQLSVGFSLEELEMILHPMVEDAQEPVGSMGDDTPIAVLSDRYRGLHHFFRQTFSQVTNPPIDSLRETRVMTLKTRLGNLGNVLDEDQSQCDLLQLESPVLSTAEFQAMWAFMGSSACVVDCTFPVAEGEAGLRAALERIRRDAEEGVRAGCTHVILTDENDGPDRAPIPMILATGGVHTH
ncbi:MAG TPA: glutamate synthase central domain-containing protein, partial [Acetobacteraceae bacterium]|nr:glutamate synthase central domain-containing protein [Acetobacteraceae bacterium]